ncbi:tRNA (N(6)-L-threonylcarbamoyladenosine(37)-C(2))-methylthiotransferase MtaB [Anaerofustis stercorihominis]|uniref:tRNA (N(6)-L-threonylcarbamoyladenosine(37)-C(2))- methylthiotransferase MtaB n=1 Tax=Anaerofustis stercorihominis TaxID=214853 RepID=UPI00214BDA23|nr:tRNA (N(6)-L-threonylcarbamoyladenosine(37)-C(2))-methylthiotransferase MtaB [Anaerofustis stercorihominis]MCR2033171.1 tRNA (N(6)-L-threonylcarbamoyladenosine(37)-C(2))-methylthiotransferase MtaB [Anaerofustis stercorihominis]
MKAAFYTLGCRVNSYDTQTMIELFKTNGYEIVDAHEKADVYIINTCAVTNESERKSKQIVRRLKKQNENAITVLTGCFAESNFEEAKKVDSADIVCGTHKREKIIDYINQFKEKQSKVYNLEEDSREFDKVGITTYDGKSRAFIKVQDGCNMFCTYCIIPYARGVLKNASVEKVLSQIDALSKKGYREVVITGIHVASYKADTGENLIDLLELIDKENKIDRIRLGSLEPKLLTDTFLNRLSKLKSFCPHFHISLQSGCDKTLKEMNRKYTTEEYMEIVQRVRKYFDDPGITTDIIVGFPNETDEDFEITKEFTDKVGFSYVHIFPYSPKHGTPASEMNNQITKEVKSKRAKELKEVMENKREDFLDDMIGKREKVLIEKKLNDDMYEGYSENYIYVEVKSDKDIFNKIVDVRITEKTPTHLRGEII